MAGCPTLPALLELVNEQGTAVKVIHAQNPDAYLQVSGIPQAFLPTVFRTRLCVVISKRRDPSEPERTVIGADVTIGAGTVVYPKLRWKTEPSSA